MNKVVETIKEIHRETVCLFRVGTLATLTITTITTTTTVFAP